MKKFINLLLVLVVAVSATNTQAVLAKDAGAIKRLIRSLEVGEAVEYENLTIIPIYAPGIKDPTHYTTLDEALKNNWLTITEVEGGHVPQVKLTNHSNKYIFIIGGEILTGCKQDRIVGRDVLIRPKGKNIIVPVYCVEQGRWRYTSKEFYSKGNVGLPQLRAEAQMSTPFAQDNIWSKSLPL